MMKITTILFTGTENTKLVLDRIINEFNTSKVINYNAEDIVNGKDSFHSFSSEELLIIAYPIYDLKPPRIVMEAISKLGQNTFKLPVVVIGTKGTLGGDANSYAAKALESKGYYTIAQYSFFCPSNGIATYENPYSIRMRKVRFEPKLKNKIRNAVKDIEKRYNNFRNKPFKILTPIWPIYDLVRKLSVKHFGERYYRGLKINSHCTYCLQCFFRCPDKNLVIINGRIEAIDRDNCLHCLRCVTECPTGAIDFTSSARRNTYSKELRDKLFAKIDC